MTDLLLALLFLLTAVFGNRVAAWADRALDEFGGYEEAANGEENAGAD